MKRNKLDLKLKRRLELVRTTVRELTPAELRRVNGGEFVTRWCTDDTCCGNPYTLEPV